MAARANGRSAICRSRSATKVLSVCVLAVGLAACGGDDDAAPASTAAEAAAEVTASAATVPAEPVVYAGGATAVSGTVEYFVIHEGSVTTDEDGSSHSRDGSVSYTLVANDPRVSGVVRATWNSDRWGVIDNGALVQWGDVVLTNDGGTWEGSFNGVMVSDFGGDMITRWLVGSGGYEGLTFFFWLPPYGIETAEEAEWSGLIYPGPPPPNAVLDTGSPG